MEYNTFIETLKSFDSALQFGTNNSLAVFPEPSGDSESLKALEELINAKDDSKVSKVIAAAMKIAETVDSTYKGHSESEYDLASNADDIATRIVGAKKIADGDTTVEKFVQDAIDRAHARAVVFLEDVIDNGLPRVKEVLSKVITKACPEAEKYMPALEEICNELRAPVKKLLKIGLDTAATAAKKSAPVLIKAGKEWLQKKLKLA